jgi:hypothetical protein
MGAGIFKAIHNDASEHSGWYSIAPMILTILQNEIFPYKRSIKAARMITNKPGPIKAFGRLTLLYGINQ